MTATRWTRGGGKKFPAGREFSKNGRTTQSPQFSLRVARPLASGLARFGQIREDSRPSFGFEDRHGILAAWAS